MPKYCYFLIISFLVVTDISAQNYIMVPADRDELQEKMDIIKSLNIKKRTEWKYIIIDGNVSDQKYIDRIVKYDQHGRKSETVFLDQQGNKQSIKVYEYNVVNIPAAEIEFLPSGELVGKTVYNYTISGFLKEITWYNNFEYIISKNYYQTDTVLNTVTERCMHTPDSVEWAVIYKYSDLYNGKIEEELYFSGENKPEYKKLVYRNENEKIKKENLFNTDDKLVYTFDYEYSPKGNLKSIIRKFSSGGEVTHYECRYSDMGLLLGEVNYNLYGEILEYIKYNYE
ncbi:MAG: hypothetical protein JW894_01155 [Bacteroidales bacterium]|nr:hypothetical protein [Bacteroidales bacterium]